MHLSLAAPLAPRAVSTAGRAPCGRVLACVPPLAIKRDTQSAEADGFELSRRVVLGGLLAASSMGASPAHAIQGLTAGRVMGISSTANEQGLYEYMRPEGKSGGHGVGWSEIPRYSFQLPAGWKEVPVSIADLGGTEIDLRCSSEMGEISIVVAPVLRFADVGYNAKVRIEDIGTPLKVIQGFGPELYGKTIDDEDIFSTATAPRDGLTYYYFETRPHNLTTATATGNRMFIMSIRANSRQWKKFEPELRRIHKSFYVPEV